MFDIAIILVNYFMTEDIRQLLASIKEDLAGSSLKVKVVVVDNTPEDGAWLMLKNNFPEVHPVRNNGPLNLNTSFNQGGRLSVFQSFQEREISNGVKYLPQDRNLGFGRAQNIGLQSVEAKYYFILNPDAVFPAGERVLVRLRQFMETHPKIGMVGPKLLNSDGTLQYSCYRFPSFWMPLYRRSSLGEKPRNKKKVEKYLMKDFDHKKTQPVDWLMGSAMFVRGEALKQVGLFDERFWMYFEDCDLCRRFWDAHWPVYYLHDIKIKHHYGKGSAKVPGLLRSILKNPLTRVHITSWLKYMWKWRFLKM